MTITRILCDLCFKEVDTFGDLEEVNFDTKSGMKCSYAVCKECRQKIVAYAQSIRADDKGQTDADDYCNDFKPKEQTEPSYDKCDLCVNLGEMECGVCTNYSGYAPRTKTDCGWK